MDASYNQPLRYLVQSQGWREHLFSHLMRELTKHDKYLRSPQVPEAVRHDAAGRITQILEVVAWVYRQAGEPNPVDVYRMGLWSEMSPEGAEAVQIGQRQQAPSGQRVQQARPYRPGGGVA